MKTLNRTAEYTTEINLGRYGVMVAVVWTLFVVYSLYWDDVQHRDEALLLGRMQGQAFFEKDLLYRRWASRHGGVYVPVTESTLPNPLLSHIPERDITTPSGRQLTLMNPAYMTRQVFEMAQEYTGTGRGHITSLKPVRPENASDPWEREVLRKFEQGVTELGEIEHVDGKPYYRYMKALKTEKPCLKCHASQGYQEGDIRGGLSVSVEMAPIYAMMAKEMRGVYVNHALIWLLGLGVIGFGTRTLVRVTTRLSEKNRELEQEIENRQMAQEALQLQTVQLEEEIAERQTAQEALQEQAVLLEEEIAERRQVEEAVRSSEEKFSRAFENAPIMMTISRVDDGVYLNVNRKFTELSGFSHEEAVGSDPVSLGWMSEEQQSLLRTKFHDAVSVAGVELQLEAKEGKSITCICYGESISVDGRPCQLLLAHDVTEHRLMEVQLRHSQKMEAVGQLAGGVAHDFNNILTVIMGYCNLLQMDSGMDQQQREAIEHIVSSSEKAAQLTRSLLMFSRKEVMERRTCDLRGIVHQVQKFLVRIIGEDIDLKVSGCDEAIPVNVDASQMEQVLINLATNARDAMENGGVLTIETCLEDIDEMFVVTHGGEAPGRYGCIVVSDTGAGMDADTCKRIFEPFFTTKEIGKGTGLGMAIVYGIVKQHHGFIDVCSVPELGTTFRIYLPVFAQEEPVGEEQPVQDAPAGQGETLLLAEDEIGVRNILNNILTAFGYSVILTADGEEAVEMFRAHSDSIALVLMDVIMPRKNGQEALREIRQIRPGMKALYLSGYTADFIKSRGINDEGDEVITKPFQQLDLLRKVRAALDR